ncbi:hypothetical protein D3C81_1693840 [compost metagenome]
MFLAGDDHVRVDQQRLGEDQPLLAFGRAVEEAQRQAVAAPRRRQAFLPVASGLQLEVDAGALGHQGDEVGADAGMPPGGVDDLEWPPVGVDAQRDRRVDLQISALRVGQRDGLGRCRQRQPGEQEERRQPVPSGRQACALAGAVRRPCLLQALAGLRHAQTSSLFGRDEVGAGP